MALQDRIFSLETEYAVSFLGENDRKPGAGTIIEVLVRAVSQSHSVPSSDFLFNGSKLAHDVGHAEWSLPECRSAREAAAYDKAADHLFLETVIPRADKMLARDGFTGRLMVTKNNADSFGNSYGCHENYQMKRNADLLSDENFVRYIAQTFVPFLVTRQILTGAGRLVGQRPLRGGQSFRYELSQRSGFIQTVVSRDTTRARPIFNLGREGESFTVGNFRRLHLIVGDANLSGWATWIKMGTTGLLLRLVEDLFFDQVPVLQDPVGAIKAISNNPASQVTLQDGRHMSALDIQWMYYNLADQYLTVFGASDDDEHLMEEWGRALEDYERDPMLLRDRADWAIKRQLLDKFLEQQGLTLEETDDPAVITELQALDLRYHELRPDGLYSRLYPIDTLLSAEEIQFAQEYPPPYTRARIRGEIARLVKECGLEGGSSHWTEAHLQDERLRIINPLEFDHMLLAAWDQPWVMLEEQVQRAPNDETLLHRLGKSYQSQRSYQKALPVFRAAVERRRDHAVYLYDLAKTLLLLGRYEEAIPWYEKYNQAVVFGDEFIADEISIGDAYRLNGNDQRAFQAYRQAVQANSLISGLAYSRMALMHLKRGEVQSAETYLRKSLEVSAERHVTWVALGVIQAARGESEPARVLLGDMLNLAPSRAILAPTEYAMRYFGAVAAIGLERENGLETLHAALTNQTAEAADGLYAVEPLLRMLAESAFPCRDARAAWELVHGIQPVIDAPDPAELPAMLQRRAQWLEKALHYPGMEVRLQAIQYVTWRFEQCYHPPALDWLVALLLDKAHHDTEPRVRRAAILALGHYRLAGMNLTNELIKCLQDDCLAVRWAAEASLVQVSQHRSAALVPPATVLFGEPVPETDEEPGQHVPDDLLDAQLG